MYVSVSDVTFVILLQKHEAWGLINRMLKQCRKSVIFVMMFMASIKIGTFMNSQITMLSRKKRPNVTSACFEILSIEY